MEKHKTTVNDILLSAVSDTTSPETGVSLFMVAP